MKSNRQCTTKRDVMKQILAFPGFGLFLASANWQLFRLRFPTYPSSEDGQFALLGPGARSGVNWIMQFPPLFAKEARDIHTADFFADQVSHLHSIFSRNQLWRPLARGLETGHGCIAGPSGLGFRASRLQAL